MRVRNLFTYIIWWILTLVCLVYRRASVNFANILCWRRSSYLNLWKLRTRVRNLCTHCVSVLFLTRTNVPKIYGRASVNFKEFLIILNLNIWGDSVFCGGLPCLPIWFWSANANAIWLCTAIPDSAIKSAKGIQKVLKLESHLLSVLL